MTQYKPIIGLEIHVELKTASKMFCSCANDPFGADKPNIHTCPVCLGMPGALPIPNQKAIDWTIKLGLALNCQINLLSKFDRKHYFYPDLAKGYQISQYDVPFCFDGSVTTSQGIVRLNRIHLEEDTGKLLHETINGKEVSLIDFNRSGVPLVEIVTEPDIVNAQQAHEYGKKLREIVRYLEIGDCKMAEGGMRLEANISLAEIKSTQLPNYKVEVKNINSFRFLEQAIGFEIERQTKLLDQGITPTQETRGWNANTSQTFSQRTKEDAADYRYFPDPDIPPIEFTLEQIDQLKAQLPELPDQVRTRWQQAYSLSTNNAQQLSPDQATVHLMDLLFATAQKNEIAPNDLANDLVNKKIKYDQKQVPENTNHQQLIANIIKQFNDLHQTQSINRDVLDEAVKQVLANNLDAVEKLQAGKQQIVGFLIGQVMKSLPEKIDPALIRQVILTQLKLLKS
jgi:aspartyl-tRNA(Asn)/glutamyl-tRNA(Gln) amidotransferase subunit B